MSAPQWSEPGAPPADDQDPLTRMSSALELATDEYRDALNAEAEAEAAHKRKHAIEFIKGRDEKLPATLLDKWAKARSVDEEAALIFAVARTRRSKAKVDLLANQLSAWQSYARIVGRQT